MSSPTDNSIVRKRLTITGRVQGVGFRWFVKDLTQGLDLTGFVRNLPDGSVEVEAQGEEELVQTFFGQVKRGPRHARVEHAEESGLGVSTGERGFEIR